MRRSGWADTDFAVEALLIGHETRFGSLGANQTVTIAVPGGKPKVCWTLGRPCEWLGPWDEVKLELRAPKDDEVPR